MFLRCSYFLAKSEADVLINSVLIKRKACNCIIVQYVADEPFFVDGVHHEIHAVGVDFVFCFVGGSSFAEVEK